MDLAGALALGERELVAFVGAGGKKTAMAHLLERAGERGRDAAYTTTTHTPPLPGYPLVVAPTADLPAALADRSPPFGFAAERVADPDRVDEKVRGYSPGVVADCFASGRFDWLLVKADGARQREFKAPGPDEPVVPATTTHVVALASVRAVGEPLDAPVVHRPERVAALTGLSVGDPITPEAVGRVLAADDGGHRHVPPDATVTPVVNKADTPEQRVTARTAIETALSERADCRRGLVTSFERGFLEVVVAGD